MAPREAGDLRIVNILDDGMTYIAETTLQNNGTKPVRAALQAVAPEGWTVVTGPPILAAAPQAEASALCAFKAPADTPMGRYSFTVKATLPGEKPAERSTAAWFVPPKANRVVNPSFDENDGRAARGWAPYMKGYTLDAGAYTGKACIKSNNVEGEGSFGTMQTISLQQKAAAPIVVRGFSKCENVPGAADANYGVYVDIYYADGTALYGQTLEFAPDTRCWQYLERIIEPAKPINVVNLYLFIRGRRGTVCFDDVTVAEDETQEGDLALASGGTKVATDSSYAGYTPSKADVASLGSHVSV